MNAENIAKSLEAITVVQDGETTKPLQEFADFVRQQALEITGLKLEWQVWYDQNLALRDRIAYLESQVHGGTTQ